MTKSIKVIVLDLDGTLLNSEHRITERTEKALKTAVEKGAQVVLATGKSYTAGQVVVQQLGLTFPGIYLQGLAVYDGTGQLRYQQTLDPQVARQVITFAEDRGFAVAAYSGNRIMIRRAVSYSDELNRYHEPMPEVVGPLQNILDDMPVNKLLAFGEPQRIKSLRWQLGMQLNGSVRLLQTHIRDNLEILPPGTSKGAALKVLLKDMKVQPHEVMAIGDAENDMEMIELAGIGVAVGNADQRLKDAADYVVASNDEDGVAEAVERFVLETEKPAETPQLAETTAAPVTTEPKTEENA